MRFLWRFTRALLLMPDAYEDVEADTHATWQSAAVVVLSSVAAAVGVRATHGRPSAIIGIVLLALGTWVMWSLVTYEIGANVLPARETDVTYGQMLRTIGLASAPGVFRVAGLVPGYTLAAFVVTSVWMLAAMVVAVRQALDYSSTARALGVCAIGWLLSLGFAAAIAMLSSPLVESVVLR